MENSEKDISSKVSYPAVRSLLVFTVLFALVSIVAILSITENDTAKEGHGKLFEKSDLAIYTTAKEGLPEQDALFRLWSSDEAISVADTEHLWIKIRLNNPTDKDFRAVLEIGRRWVDEASLYVKKDGDGYEHFRTGRAIPFEEKLSRAIFRHFLCMFHQILQDCTCFT